MRFRTYAIAAAMLAAAWTLPLPAPWGVPAASRADTVEERAAAARAAGEELGSADEAVRTKAAKRLAALGSIGAAELVRRGPDLDDTTWTAAADAFVAAGSSEEACTFVSAARRAQPAHAKRLLALAHALDPLAGVERTPAETAALVAKILDESHRARCATGSDARIAALGHAAVEPLLASMRDGDPKHPGGSIACSAVSLLAEKEDLPAIRELFLAGKVNLVRVYERMQSERIPEATDTLLEFVEVRGPHGYVTRALWDAPDKARVLEVANAWIAGQERVGDRDRANLAELFARLGARKSAPLLQSWVATTKDPDTIVEIADALVGFGEPQGVGLLVQIAGERKTRFPCRPSTPEENAAASAPGRLCPDGFDSSDRGRAAEKLSAIAGKDVFDVPEDWIRRLALQGRDGESQDHFLDRAAEAFRTWWTASKDKLRCDPLTGRWTY